VGRDARRAARVPARLGAQPGHAAGSRVLHDPLPHGTRLRDSRLLQRRELLAKKELIARYGFKDYGGKHQESRFTKFYQEIYLPARYGFDKRRLHVSSQIVAGQLTRAAALRELEVPLSSPDAARREVSFVAKKLGIPTAELERLVAQPPVDHDAYPGATPVIRAGAKIKALLRRLAR
jgi:hypothetical protein